MTTGSTGRKPRYLGHRPSLSIALVTGVLGWALWEQSDGRPWTSRSTFETRGECLEALTERVHVLEVASRRTSTPVISQVYEVAASLWTLEDQRSGVFLVCLPSDTDLRPR